MALSVAMEIEMTMAMERTACNWKDNDDGATKSKSHMVSLFMFNCLIFSYADCSISLGMCECVSPISMQSSSK